MRQGSICAITLVLLFTGCSNRDATLLDSGWHDGPKVLDQGPVKLDGPQKKDGPAIVDGAPLTDGPKPVDGMPPDGPPLQNDTCQSAQPLTLVNGTVTVKGDTTALANEYGTAVNCGGGLTSIMQGAQAYYSLPMKANQTYLVTLTPAFNNARLYLFTTCGATQINTDCGSGGATGDVSPAIQNGTAGSLLFTPTTAGTFYVAVDSTSANADGPFTLTIDEFTLPTNTTCATAATLNVPVGGAVTVKSTTANVANEFGTQITCGDTYTMDGPQLYYKVAMTAGKTYRVTWVPQFSYSRVYIFGTTCTAPAINAACGSSGVTGDYSGVTTAGQENTMMFKPTQSGTYSIAMDSRQATASGLFTLTVQDWSPPQNATCATAQALQLVGGKVTVTGDTYGAANEFGQQITCGTSTNLDGSQVYYSIAMDATKNYKLTLTPSFAARMYVASGSCTAVAINTSCGSGGVSGAVSGTINPNATATVLFKPAASGTFTVAVDSPYTTQDGAFTLTIEEYVPPQNGTCATAQALTFVGNKATVSGDTTGVANEFGTQITCNYYGGAFDGPQLYYSVALAANTTYLVRLKPGYLARYYIATSGCTVAGINTSCGSGGVSGDYASVNPNSTGTIAFTPGQAGTYIIAVDSQNAVYYGAFTLEVEKFTVPANAACQTPQTVNLTPGGTVAVNGDTSFVPNEFGTAINCGSLSTQNILIGSQLYYQVNLTAGKAYSFSFTPSYNYARFYIFTNTCTFTVINTDCGSTGVTGLIAGATSGSTATGSFTPTTSGIYKICVDATRNQPSAAGTFNLQITSP